MTVLPRRTRGIAVPYRTPEIVGDHDGPGGATRVYLEQFDEDSWRDLPADVPIVHSHDRRWVLGRGHLSNQREGLMVSIEWLDQHTQAADAVAEIRSGLVRGLSVSFRPDPEQDVVQKGNRKMGLPGVLPRVTRRGSILKDVALTIAPAYRGAVITAVDEDQANTDAGAAVLAQARAHLEPVLAERRRANDEFLAGIQATVDQAKAAIAGQQRTVPAEVVTRARATLAQQPARTPGHVVEFRGSAWFVPAALANSELAAISRLERIEDLVMHSGLDASLTRSAIAAGIRPV